jgi:hypothetical protein
MGPTIAAVCDKNAQVDLSAKLVDCTGIPRGNLYGDTGTCALAAGACSLADRTALLDVLTCADKLPACTESAKEAWIGARTGCVARLSGVSTTCRDAFQGLLPEPSGAFDAGVPDAGPQPWNDGGSALELVAVADDESFAFAWTSFQGSAQVARWALIGIGDGGIKDVPRFISMASRREFLLEDAGTFVTRRWFLVGENATGEVANGLVDAGQVDRVPDAGRRCRAPIDCSVELVCDLGECRVQTCQSGGAQTCPSAYACFPSGTCNRVTSDAGLSFDAGLVMPMPSMRPLPLISNESSATKRPVMPSSGVTIGGFPGKRPDVIGIDTARAFVVLEQDGQLIGHASFRRGRDFVDDAQTASLLDTVGNRARLAYNPDGRSVYACYIVGRGVRVRRSVDDGRTWGETATTIEPPLSEDGGVSSNISECDIAPWRQGAALMVTVEDESLVVRTVSAELVVETPGQIAMTSMAPDAGNVFRPIRPAIATLPADGLVHVVFTANRLLTNGLTDFEPYGVYRDGTTGTFGSPMMLTFTGVPPFGNPLPQDYATVAIDPRTKRGIAAYTTLFPGAEVVSSIQVSLWSENAPRRWVTGSDLNVFQLDVDNQTRLLFPGPEFQGRLVDAFSPVLAALPNGKVWLSMVVGPRAPTGGNDFRFYAVPFDFDEPTPAGNVRGWYKRPARKLSEVRVFDPRGGGLRPTVTAFSADTQISVMGVVPEGLGQAGEEEGGRATFISLP